MIRVLFGTFSTGCYIERRQMSAACAAQPGKDTVWQVELAKFIINQSVGLDALQ